MATGSAEDYGLVHVVLAQQLIDKSFPDTSAWHAEAVCRQKRIFACPPAGATDPEREAFFPKFIEENCGHCAVLGACLNVGVEGPEGDYDDVWGGQSPEDVAHVRAAMHDLRASYPPPSEVWEQPELFASVEA